MPRSHVRIFRNERTRSIPLDPKLTVWCVLFHLGAFEAVWLPYKTVQTSAKVRARSRVRIFRKERIRSTPFDPKLTFWCISYHSGPFGCLRKFSGKWAELVRSCHEVALEFFATKAPGPRAFNPKLMFWCISYYLGAFGTVWPHYKTRCKTGRTSAKVRATKSRRNFS